MKLYNSLKAKSFQNFFLEQTCKTLQVLNFLLCNKKHESQLYIMTLFSLFLLFLLFDKTRKIIRRSLRPIKGKTALVISSNTTVLFVPATQVEYPRFHRAIPI